MEWRSVVGAANYTGGGVGEGRVLRTNPAREGSTRDPPATPHGAVGPRPEGSPHRWGIPRDMDRRRPQHHHHHHHRLHLRCRRSARRPARATGYLPRRRLLGLRAREKEGCAGRRAAGGGRWAAGGRRAAGSVSAALADAPATAAATLGDRCGSAGGGGGRAGFAPVGRPRRGRVDGGRLPPSSPPYSMVPLRGVAESGKEEHRGCWGGVQESVQGRRKDKMTRGQKS